MVHQRLLCSERHTVLENIVLGWSGLPFFPRRRKLRAQVAQAIEKFGFGLGGPASSNDDILDAPMHTLPVGTRQKVEIARALFHGARILILDEPTAVLSRPEITALFDSCREFCAGGGGVVFISHKLDEVLDLADRITVLRRGVNVATHRAGDTDSAALAVEMIGADSAAGGESARAPEADADAIPEARMPGAKKNTLLRLVDVSMPGDRPTGSGQKNSQGGLDGVSLQVAAGEILGVAGVAGSGQNALAELLAGLRQPASGELELFGKARSGRGCNARRFAAEGVAYIPADRDRTGLAGSLSVAENLALRRYHSDFSRRGLFSWPRLEDFARASIAEHRIACPGENAPVATLSGGNRQKVIVARELTGQPRLIVAAYPFRGLDVGAAGQVRERLLAARGGGAAIVLFSEDLDEIFAMSDRIAVMFRGRVVGEVPASQATPERVGLWMGGHLDGGDVAAEAEADAVAEAESAGVGRESGGDS